MSFYSATAPITAIGPGDSKVVWSTADGKPATGTKSDRVAIAGLDATSIGGPGGISVEVNFSADPGAFQIDVQEADTDTDSAYVTVGGATPSSSLTAVNAGFYGRIELWPLQCKFVRLIMTTTPANAVTLNAKIGR